MSDNLDQKLEKVVQRRKKVVDDLTRLRGRKEQAEANLSEVEEECRAKNIDPDNIEEIISKLEGKYSKLIEDLEKDTEEAERALAPFVGGENR
mgnify:CR=1 FL=1